MKSIRRNVTVNKTVAANLEHASWFTGRSQGELLEAALYQPIMQRLWAFTNPPDGNPITCLLEEYQVNEGHMTPRAGETILKCVKEWVMDRAVVKDSQERINTMHDTNSYIAGHMTRGSMLSCPYFNTVKEEASMNAFLTPEMEPEKLKAKVVEYINAIMGGPMDRHMMGEAYLFRNLLVILTDCFGIPTEEDTVHMYEQLSDGHVLPYYNT